MVTWIPQVPSGSIWVTVNLGKPPQQAGLDPDAVYPRMRSLPDPEIQTSVTVLVEAGDAPVRPYEVLEDLTSAEIVRLRQGR